MPEWQVEEGIGEHRAALIDGADILAARVDWPGRLAPGWVVDSRLVSRARASTRGTARMANGEEILLDRLPPAFAEGSPVRVAVTRAALDSPGRFKRAQGHVIDAPLAQPSLAQRLTAQGERVRIVRRFAGSDWDAVIDDALAGTVDFPGGALLLAPTPAMTTIDVDGELPPLPLALAAVAAIATALRRFDLTGSIAVDFPTLSAKTDRRAVDDALSAALADWPHERTAMNGFGLVQIVARLERPSLLHLSRWRRGAVVWRRLLRRAETLGGAGSLELIINPALAAEATSDHISELARRSGRRVAVRPDPTLAFDAPHAQLVIDG